MICFFQFNQIIYSSSPISWPSFKPLAQIVFKISCWQILKSPNFRRAITPEKYGKSFLNFNQVIYSSSLISWPSFKPLAQILFEISCWKDFIQIFKKCPNFQRAITAEKYGESFLNFNQVIYSSSPISWPSFKPLAQILFELSCWQDFIQIFSKGDNSRKGDNSDKKKNTGQLFFHEESIYEISKP